MIETSGHLPDCGQYCDGKPPKCRGGDCTLCDEVDCICPALLACEQRTLSAARDAVAGVAVRKDTSHDMRVQALAAIDALRTTNP